MTSHVIGLTKLTKQLPHQTLATYTILSFLLYILSYIRTSGSGLSKCDYDIERIIYFNKTNNIYYNIKYN